MAKFDAIGEMSSMLSSMAMVGSAAQIAMLAVEKSAAIASIIINTLAANAKAKATMGPVAGTIWSIANSITGAASIAKIVGTTITDFKDKKNNDKPGYASGGYTAGERMYIAGEAGTEWIAPNKMVNSPVTGPIIAALENMRNSKLSPAALQTFASGGFNSSSASGAQISPPSSSKEGAGGGSYADSAIIAKLDEMINRIEKIQPTLAIEKFEREQKKYVTIKKYSGL
jgi:hypothetical protein